MKVTLAEEPDASDTEAAKEQQDTPTSQAGSRPQSSVKDEVLEEVDIDLPTGREEDFDTEPVDVSPVPTPRLPRPETSYGRRLSLEEQVARITCGDMDVKYSPLTKMIKIFIHGGMTGTVFFFFSCSWCCWPPPGSSTLAAL